MRASLSQIFVVCNLSVFGTPSRDGHADAEPNGGQRAGRSQVRFRRLDESAGSDALPLVRENSSHNQQ
jgi:hypothetical protein